MPSVLYAASYGAFCVAEMRTIDELLETVWNLSPKYNFELHIQPIAIMAEKMCV